MKVVAIRDILNTKPDSWLVIKAIETGVNEILEKTKGKLKSIKINSSIHVRDYEAFTIRVIGES